MSLYILDRNKYNQQPEPNGEPFADHNPYKRHRRVKDEEKVPAEIWDKYTRQILDLVLYDVEDCEALRNFETVKNNTHCIFSKRSVLWGARDYDKELTLGKVVSAFPTELLRKDKVAMIVVVVIVVALFLFTEQNVTRLVMCTLPALWTHLYEKLEDYFLPSYQQSVITVKPLNKNNPCKDAINIKLSLKDNLSTRA